jgi:hypothetical protein
MTTAVIACGALAIHVRQIARRRGWDVDVVPVPALLHNRPEQIPGAVAQLAGELRERYDRVVVGYGDCGTYGALDEVGLERLRGEHCYDVFAREEVAAAMADEPGTYFLTDFLARTFQHTVVRELGLVLPSRPQLLRRVGAPLLSAGVTARPWSAAASASQRCAGSRPGNGSLGVTFDGQAVAASTPEPSTGLDRGRHWRHRTKGRIADEPVRISCYLRSTGSTSAQRASVSAGAD